MIIVFASTVIYFHTKLDFSNTKLAVSGAVIIVGLITPEIVRSYIKCTLKQNKIDITTGIFNKKHRKFFTNTITDIHIKQSLIQRILNYGTIKVSSFSQGGEIILGNVDKPQEAVAEIEKLISIGR